MSNVGFIGVGKLGMPCAEAIAKKGHNVVGYDISSRHSDIIKTVETIKEVTQGKDIVFVAVPKLLYIAQVPPVD